MSKNFKLCLLTGLCISLASTSYPAHASWRDSLPRTFATHPKAWEKLTALAAGCAIGYAMNKTKILERLQERPLTANTLGTASALGATAIIVFLVLPKLFPSERS